MTKAIPAVQKYMSYAPHTIGQKQTLATAHDMMREHRIRHLPVLEGGQLVGLISQRDLSLVESLKDVDPEQVCVEDAMSQTVYHVSPEAPLDEVAAEMAEHKYGSAVVMSNGKVVGMFTTPSRPSLTSCTRVWRSKGPRRRGPAVGPPRDGSGLVRVRPARFARAIVAQPILDRAHAHPEQPRRLHRASSRGLEG